MSAQPTFSVIIATYTEARWSDLVEAARSALNQTAVAVEVIVVADHNPTLLDRVRESLPAVCAVENSQAKGVSGARNSGVVASTGRIVAFLDDDAVASPTWLDHLAEGFADKRVLGVGGSIQPLWLDKEPCWLPAEFRWVIGGTYRGMPESTAPVRNIWSGNMSVRREVFDAIGGFRTGFGKVDGRSCPEDTDFCLRAGQQCEGIWLFKPDAQVLHKVPASRATLGYFLWRCYNEGIGKAHLSRLVGKADGLRDERRHALLTLPRGLIRELADGILHRDPAGLGRASAIALGLGLAGAGYVVGAVDFRPAGRSAIG